MESARLRAFPTVVSMGTRATLPAETFGWHTHPFDELCLVAEHRTTIGHAGKEYAAGPGSLFLFRSGEAHGFWNRGDQSPDLWVLHFLPGAEVPRLLPALSSPDPKRRVWKLDEAQQREFRSHFVTLSFEVLRGTPEAHVTGSAWLQLMLASVHRWTRADAAPALRMDVDDPELIDLWQWINGSVGKPLADLASLAEKIPNYDSVRHRFRRMYGVSPRAMMLKLRIQRAQHLLLEGQLTVKEIARAVGYQRQHEFARAFRSEVGSSPTEWRRRPRLSTSLLPDAWEAVEIESDRAK